MCSLCSAQHTVYSWKFLPNYPTNSDSSASESINQLMQDDKLSPSHGHTHASFYRTPLLCYILYYVIEGMVTLYVCIDVNLFHRIFL